MHCSCRRDRRTQTARPGQVCTVSRRQPRWTCRGPFLHHQRRRIWDLGHDLSELQALETSAGPHPQAAADKTSSKNVLAPRRASRPSRLRMSRTTRPKCRRVHASAAHGRSVQIARLCKRLLDRVLAEIRTLDDLGDFAEILKPAISSRDRRTAERANDNDRRASLKFDRAAHEGQFAERTLIA